MQWHLSEHSQGGTYTHVSVLQSSRAPRTRQCRLLPPGSLERIPFPAPLPVHRQIWPTSSKNRPYHAESKLCQKAQNYIWHFGSHRLVLMRVSLRCADNVNFSLKALVLTLNWLFKMKMSLNVFNPPGMFLSDIFETDSLIVLCGFHIKNYRAMQKIEQKSNALQFNFFDERFPTFMVPSSFNVKRDLMGSTCNPKTPEQTKTHKQLFHGERTLMKSVFIFNLTKLQIDMHG